MSGVVITLLGPVDLTVDGEPRAPQRALARAVLAVLGAHRSGPVSQDRVADALVEAGLCATMSRNGLQAQVSRLRDRLGAHGGLLAHTPGGYRLHGEALERDVDVVDRLVLEGAQARASGDWAAALERHDAALTLHRGTLCADLPELRLLDAQRAHYLRIGRELVEDAAGDRLLVGETGRIGEAVDLLARQLEDEPLRERSWAYLVAGLWLAGHQADALAAYERGRRALADEAGLDPGPLLRSVQQAVFEQAAPETVLDLLDLSPRGTGVPALVWLDSRGEARRRFLSLDRSTTIGRHLKTVVRLEHPTVAEWHAMVRRETHGWTVAGFDPLHPVLLNGAPVETGAVVPGDVIRCGDVALMVATAGR